SADRRPVPAAERRAVLPDRRTEAEPRPTKADRRRGADDRRHAPPASRPRLVPPPTPPSAPLAAPAADPLLAVVAAVESGRYAEAADLAAEVTTADPLRAQAHYLHG